MNNKELIEKLNSLKAVGPDNGWREDNREILTSQIFNSTVASEECDLAVFTLPQKITRFFSQPAWAVFLIALIIISGGVFSTRAARDIKPGGSLFIARIISEKAQLAITFNKEEKNKLGIKFASDHAKEITRVLAETDLSEENKIKTDKLTQDFKREINEVRNKLREMNIAKEEGVKEEINEGEADVFSANLKREEEGVKLYFPKSGESEESDQAEDDSEQAISKEEVATSTGETFNADSGANLEDAHKILEEAEELFDEKDYDGAEDKLEEVDAIIEGVDSYSEEGEVKGADEIATTTDDNDAN